MDNKRITELLNAPSYTFPINLEDHFGGVARDGTNAILNRINNYAANHNTSGTVILDTPVDSEFTTKYPNLKFKFNDWIHREIDFHSYNIHPEISYENLVCSFNGAHSNARRLLVSILNKFKLFNDEYSSKNFKFSWDNIYGDIRVLSHTPQECFYDKFFISDDDFCNKIVNFSYSSYSPDHRHNIDTLENKLVKSFVQVSAETIATSYYPFYSEKFLMSVITRGLFVFYAQPNWHQKLEKFFGFKKYDKIFDYKFDQTTDPIARLFELVLMISKFQHLSKDDWVDLYLLEQDTIEYNYDRYFSGDYIKDLKS